MKIWVNTIVNNEENFIWFSIMSVLDYVDKILVWDTGSKDKTVDILKHIKKVNGRKIDFRQVGPLDNEAFTKMRQAQLEASNCDWILILDGDEIWWENSIKKLVEEIRLNGDKLDGIVVPMIVSVGDIYHFQEEKAGRYNLLGREGHFNLRAISRKIEGLHLDFPHPLESYLDKKNIPVQQMKNVIFLDAPYLHVTHLKRSDKKRINKFKYELGNPVTKDFKYPEVLYKSYPDIVSSPWIKISGIELLKAKLLTPIRKLKRRLI